jgi:hypothetical protein
VTGTRSRAGYERSDANPRSLVLAGLLLALLVAGSLAASAWISQATSEALEAEGGASPVRDLRNPPEGPELLAVPARELALLREWEQRMLDGTEWVDPVNGVVRIPVERALELSLQEGFPVRAEARK